MSHSPNDGSTLRKASKPRDDMARLIDLWLPIRSSFHRGSTRMISHTFYCGRGDEADNSPDLDSHISTSHPRR